MKYLVKPVLAAGLILAAAPIALVTPAAAQSVQGVGIVNLPAVVTNSNAYRVAEQQRQVTYKPQYDQAKARRDQLAAQLNPMVDKLRADSQLPNANRAALQTQAGTIQNLEQAGERELQIILQPVAFSQAYVEEQIREKLTAVLETAAKAKKVSLLLSPDTVLYADSALNLNQAVLDELNRVLPNAQIVPPAGWEPREMREQRAAAAAQQGQPAPAAPVTNGR